MTGLRDVRAIKNRHKEDILAHPNVLGVGAGYKITAGERTDQLCLVALVREKLPLEVLAPGDVIPDQFEEILTDVVQVGELRAFQSRTDRWRPAPPGVSIGHYRITAGTFGCVVRDQSSGEYLILSNNHVLANENDASEGDPILQPGPADGGVQSEDTLAVLHRFIPLSYEGEPDEGSCLPVQWLAGVAQGLGWNGLAKTIQAKAVSVVNLVDAAVARPVEENFSFEILDIGMVRGITSASLGMSVRKSGRTTELTSGEITILDSTVKVQYSEDRVARFENQIISSPMSQGGDSGSLLVTGNAELAVGLLFGGSDLVTIYNPIQVVLDKLGVHL